MDTVDQGQGEVCQDCGGTGTLLMYATENAYFVEASTDVQPTVEKPKPCPACKGTGRVPAPPAHEDAHSETK
jgi:RecJ-like exonuclease